MGVAGAVVLVADRPKAEHCRVMLRSSSPRYPSRDYARREGSMQIDQIEDDEISDEALEAAGRRWSSIASVRSRRSAGSNIFLPLNVMPGQFGLEL